MLVEIAARHGLILAGVAPLLETSATIAHFKSWRDQGMCGEMRYLQRDRAAEIRDLCAPFRSSAAFAAACDYRALPPRPPGHGRIARYAWGLDYHRVLKERLQAVVRALELESGRSIAHRIVTDATPLFERSVAQRAGLGFFGKNTLLIQPGRGSFLLLAEVLWDLELAPQGPAAPSGCGRCAICRDNCPTGAFVQDYLLDARRCISYLTIEKRGALEWAEREALGEWVFGCDECQEKCPYNTSSLRARRQPGLPELGGEAGPGPWLDLSQALAIRSRAEFERRFNRSALLRPRREGLLRNCAVVAANTRSEQLAPDLADAAADSQPLVRQHALWALAKLQKECNMWPAERVRSLIERAGADPVETVRAEALRLLELS